jgi:hypothetical protein
VRGTKGELSLFTFSLRGKDCPCVIHSKALFCFLTRGSDGLTETLTGEDRTPGMGGASNMPRWSCVPIVCQHNDTAAHSGAEDGSESPIITKRKIRQSTVTH